MDDNVPSFSVGNSTEIDPIYAQGHSNAQLEVLKRKLRGISLAFPGQVKSAATPEEELLALYKEYRKWNGRYTKIQTKLPKIEGYVEGPQVSEPPDPASALSLALEAARRGPTLAPVLDVPVKTSMDLAGATQLVNSFITPQDNGMLGFMAPPPNTGGTLGGLHRLLMAVSAAGEPGNYKQASLNPGLKALLAGVSLGAVPGAAIGAASNPEHRLRNALVGAAVGGSLGAVGGAVKRLGDMREIERTLSEPVFAKTTLEDLDKATAGFQSRSRNIDYSRQRLMGEDALSHKYMTNFEGTSPDNLSSSSLPLYDTEYLRPRITKDSPHVHGNVHTQFNPITGKTHVYVSDASRKDSVGRDISDTFTASFPGDARALINEHLNGESLDKMMQRLSEHAENMRGAFGDRRIDGVMHHGEPIEGGFTLREILHTPSEHGRGPIDLSPEFIQGVKPTFFTQGEKGRWEMPDAGWGERVRLKQSDHPQDRLEQRTSLPANYTTRLRKVLAKSTLPKGDAYARMPDNSFAVFKDAGGAKRLASFLSKTMTPRGRDVTVPVREGLKTAGAFDVRELTDEDELLKAIALDEGYFNPEDLAKDKETVLASRLRNYTQGNKKYTLFGAFDGDKLVGMSRVREEPFSSGVAEDHPLKSLADLGAQASINSTVVLPEYRHKGLATALRKLEQEKYDSLLTGVGPKSDVEAMTAFNDKTGFKKVLDHDGASHWVWNKTKTASTAVVIKGNPEYIEGNPKADAYYNALAEALRGHGYDTSFDPGEDHTTPPQADLWVGHSRGAGRLRFAPPGTKTLDVGPLEHPKAREHAESQRALAESLGLTVGTLPKDLRTVPPDEHYQVTPELLEALRGVSKTAGFANEDLAMKAHKAVVDEYGLTEADGSKYWKLKTQIYKKMGGTFTGHRDPPAKHAEYARTKTSTPGFLAAMERPALRVFKPGASGAGIPLSDLPAVLRRRFGTKAPRYIASLTSSAENAARELHLSGRGDSLPEVHFSPNDPFGSSRFFPASQGESSGIVFSHTSPAEFSHELGHAVDVNNIEASNLVPGGITNDASLALERNASKNALRWSRSGDLSPSDRARMLAGFTLHASPAEGRVPLSEVNRLRGWTPEHAGKLQRLREALTSKERLATGDRQQLLRGALSRAEALSDEYTNPSSVADFIYHGNNFSRVSPELQQQEIASIRNRASIIRRNFGHSEARNYKEQVLARLRDSPPATLQEALRQQAGH